MTFLRQVLNTSSAFYTLTLFTQKRRESCNQFIRGCALVDECGTGFLRRGGIIGVHAEEDNLQLRIGALEQATCLGRGRTVQLPIEQKQFGRCVRKEADQCLDAIYLENFVCPQFSSE